MKTDKVLLFDIYQTLVDIDINDENKKENGEKAWENFSVSLGKIGINVASDKFIELITKKRAKFYEGKDKKIHHHNFFNIISQVLKEDFRAEFSQEEIRDLIYDYRKISRGYVRLYPGVAESLIKLEKKYILAIASYAQGFYTNIELEELGIRKLFSYFIYTSDVGIHKNSPKFYERCLEIVGGKAGDCMMIGDNYNVDVLAPQKLGIKTIWVKNPATAPEYVHLFDKEPENMVDLEEFSRLPELIDQIFSAE